MQDHLPINAEIDRGCRPPNGIHSCADDPHLDGALACAIKLLQGSLQQLPKRFFIPRPKCDRARIIVTGPMHERTSNLLAIRRDRQVHKEADTDEAGLFRDDFDVIGELLFVDVDSHGDLHGGC
jgi:hypothetical protein